MLTAGDAKRAIVFVKNKEMKAGRNSFIKLKTALSKEFAVLIKSRALKYNFCHTVAFHFRTQARDSSKCLILPLSTRRRGCVWTKDYLLWKPCRRVRGKGACFVSERENTHPLHHCFAVGCRGGSLPAERAALCKQQDKPLLRAVFIGR